MRPASQQRLQQRQGMPAGVPDVGERPRGQRPQPALAPMRVDDRAVAAADRPSQPDLRRRRQRRRGQPEHARAAGEHVRVGHVGLVLARDRAAQPRGVPRLHQRHRTARSLDPRGRPPATSSRSARPRPTPAHTRPTARSTSSSPPASAAPKSSGALPRTATRWSATTAVSIPIMVSVTWDCIEGSSHEHTRRRPRVQRCRRRGNERSMGRALDRARTVEYWAVCRRHPTHAHGRAVTQAPRM